MSKISNLATETPWFRLDTDDSDWRSEDALRLAGMLEQLLIIRHFEEKLLELHGEGLVHGPVHASIWSGRWCRRHHVDAQRRRQDQRHASHAPPVPSESAEPCRAENGRDARSSELADPSHDVVYRTMAEEFSASRPGYMGGRGGSMHLKWDACGVLGSNAIVGGNPPHAVGYAFAEKMRRTGNIAVTFFGDGASRMAPRMRR